MIALTISRLEMTMGQYFVDFCFNSYKSAVNFEAAMSEYELKTGYRWRPSSEAVDYEVDGHLTYMKRCYQCVHRNVPEQKTCDAFFVLKKNKDETDFIIERFRDHNHQPYYALPDEYRLEEYKILEDIKIRIKKYIHKPAFVKYFLDQLKRTVNNADEKLKVEEKLLEQLETTDEEESE